MVVSERLRVIEQKVDYNVVSGDVNVLEYFTIHLLINLINLLVPLILNLLVRRR